MDQSGNNVATSTAGVFVKSIVIGVIQPKLINFAINVNEEKVQLSFTEGKHNKPKSNKSNTSL